MVEKIEIFLFLKEKKPVYPVAIFVLFLCMNIEFVCIPQLHKL